MEAKSPMKGRKKGEGIPFKDLKELNPIELAEDAIEPCAYTTKEGFDKK